MLGLRLKGENYEGRYVIADIRMDHDFPTERRAFFEPSGNPGGTVLIHKQPENIWRVDYQLREGESEEEALREENIRARVGAILGDIGHTQTVGTGMVEHLFRQHAVPRRLPAWPGVLHRRCRAYRADFWRARVQQWPRRMPTISAGSSQPVLNGEADEQLLDSYSPERRGATLDVFANATKSTRFMTPPTRGWRLAREAALSLSLKHEFPRGLANPRQMQPYTYSESPLTPYAGRDADFASGPVSGSASANAELADGSHLLDHAGDGMTAILFCDGSPEPPSEQRCLHNSANSTSASFRCWFNVRALRRKPERLWMANGEIARLVRRKPGTLYLLRPDLHIAGRWKTIIASEILQTAEFAWGDRRHEPDAVRRPRNRL